MKALKDVLPSFIEHRLDLPVLAPRILTNASVVTRGDRIYAVIAGGCWYMCGDGIFRPLPPGTKERDGEFSRMFVYLAHLDDDLSIVSVNEIELPPELVPVLDGPTYRGFRGFDNPRLSVWDGALYVSMCAMGTGHNPESAFFLAKIDENGPPKFADMKRIKPVLPYPTHAEKNWMPETRDFGLRFHYRLGTIADVNGNLHHPGGRADLAQFNGGSQVIATKDGALAVIHGFHKTDTFLRRYFHFFVTFNEAGSPITISEPFTLTGQQVEVVNGLCAHPDGKRLVLSYGRMGADPSMPHQELAFTATIDPKELELVS
jgi:predicted GH43/DUF377 family glycosyl hydrolase